MKKIKIQSQLAATVFAVSVAGTAIADETTPKMVLGCWDSSFAYNVINVLEDDSGYEVTAMGADMGPFKFNSGREDVGIERFGGMGLHTKFKKSDCEVSSNSVSCRVSSENMERPFTLFVQRPVSHLGTSIEVISRVPVRGLHVYITPDVMMFSVRGGRLGREPELRDTQEAVIEMANSNCSTERPQLRATFPQELRDHFAGIESEK